MKLNLSKRSVTALLTTSLCLAFATTAYAHGVAEGDQGYIEQTSGPQILALAVIEQDIIGHHHRRASAKTERTDAMFDKGQLIG
jgi:hypothetical protein